MPEIEQFIYVIRPTRPGMLTDGPTSQEQDILAQHVDHLNNLAREGKLFLAGRTQTTSVNTFGIVILNTNSSEEAQKLMESDPAVRYGVMHAKLYPYRVAVMGKLH